MWSNHNILRWDIPGRQNRSNALSNQTNIPPGTGVSPEMDGQTPLPLGKLPAGLLEHLLSKAPQHDPRVVLGPGIGLDCAVIDNGSNLWVFKAEPITFVTADIGWYAIQIAANDIATTGAVPRWYLATLLLPERKTTAHLVETITQQAYRACEQIGVSIIGGHTEITYGLDRPILIGTMIGEVERENLVTPRGAAPGDAILLTKGIPIEATAILAREFPDRLNHVLSQAEIEAAQQFLYSPGISVLQDARIATAAGRVNAMHDPTEGGLAAALWELAQASGNRLVIHPESILIPELSGRICREFQLDPLATIASGALLLTAQPGEAEKIRQALASKQIACEIIGRVETGQPEVVIESTGEQALLARPARDEITKVYE